MRVLALEYHDVFVGNQPDSSGFLGAGPASYKLPLAAFDDHLAAMASKRLTASRALEWVDAGGRVSPLFITFDDGGCGAMLAAEALEARGWYGHFFVTTGRVGTSGFLSAGQLDDLSRRGHVIGTHSVSHPRMMGKLPREDILSEWRESRAMLEDVLGSPVVTGSVPGGFYRPLVGEAAADAGIRVLFTSNPTTVVSRTSGCTVLGRYTIRSSTSAGRASGMAAGAVAPRFTQAVLYGALTFVRSIAGNQYTKLRDLFWSTR